ncbi:M23 family metallopeptidase [Anaerocolumna sp. AGMB13020]|nr:M23 family metallopeptidase [Anaerocolumna sp. AGMB13020]WOO35729.1 M23 family metallopeptidase [Anaerocolumna sp. AGMB13020]
MKKIKYGIIIEAVLLLVLIGSLAFGGGKGGGIGNFMKETFLPRFLSEENTEKKYIKWVDFDVTAEAMGRAYDLDVASQSETVKLNWIELLAYLGTRYGGDFSKYKDKDINSLAEKLKSGETTMAALTQDMKYYSYYLEVYTAVLGGFVGEYEVESVNVSSSDQNNSTEQGTDTAQGTDTTKENKTVQGTDATKEDKAAKGTDTTKEDKTAQGTDTTKEDKTAKGTDATKEDKTAQGTDTAKENNTQGNNTVQEESTKQEESTEGTVWEKKYGLKAYLPLAKYFPYSDYDDFGVSRTYGYKRRHLGHDMMGQVGTPVIAVESGYIEALGWNRYGGWRIGIRSFDGKRYYYYAHLRKNYPYNKELATGSVVQAGDVIGYLGRTGYSTTENVNNIDTPHLHFGLQLIFDESQKEGNNEIWIDCYELVKFLYRNRSETEKVAASKEWVRVYNIKDPAAEDFEKNRDKYNITPHNTDEDMGEPINENGGTNQQSSPAPTEQPTGEPSNGTGE